MIQPNEHHASLINHLSGIFFEGTSQVIDNRCWNAAVLDYSIQSFFLLFCPVRSGFVHPGLMTGSRF
jgi:hypothetical protein